MADLPPSKHSKTPQKSYRQILREEINLGLVEINRSPVGLLISGFSAGLDLSFSLFLSAVMFTISDNNVSEMVRTLLMANTYTVGFIFVVLGRSELFTEHTTLAVLPVLNGRATVTSLLRLWLLVYVGNLSGTALFAFLAWIIGPPFGIKLQAFAYLAHFNIAHTWWQILLGAMLAGWLMGLLSWLVTAARDTISQIAVVWLVTAAIGIAHLPHCIAGTTEVLSGLFAGQGITLADYGHFLLWATLGNAVGGVIFVAVIKYSHVIRSSED
jgi:formate/nitrite transporter FocA (FNT family)